jgi:hypothetical protein
MLKQGKAICLKVPSHGPGPERYPVYRKQYFHSFTVGKLYNYTIDLLAFREFGEKEIKYIEESVIIEDNNGFGQEFSIFILKNYFREFI